MKKPRRLQEPSGMSRAIISAAIVTSVALAARGEPRGAADAMAQFGRGDFNIQYWR